MGLDIYLSPIADAAANKRHYEAENAFYERPDYDQLTDEQKDEIRATIPPYVSHEDVPSTRYPDHLFNRRYLRSSYNAGGFNHAVPDMLATNETGTYPNQYGSLYWIFEPMGREWDGDEGTLTGADVPLLEQCRARALEVAEKLKTADPLRTGTASGMLGDRDHLWRRPPSEAEVLAWYREEQRRHAAQDPKQREMFGEGYSNAKGTVFGFDSGIEILAATATVGILGQPEAIIVYRASKETVESYIQSAEIVVEFIDEALMLIERDSMAHLSWSG